VDDASASMPMLGEDRRDAAAASKTTDCMEDTVVRRTDLNELS